MPARIDLQGQRFGSLVVLGESPTPRHGAHWLCRCDCGNEKVVMGQSLRRGATASCGCLQPKQATDYTGQRFGRLLVVARDGSRNQCATWLCRCDCGNQKVILSSGLPRTRSCGCLLDESRRGRKGVHRTSTPSYLGAHFRVTSARGKASEHKCACGVPAAQWAYDHTDPNEITGPWKDRGGAERIVAWSADPSRYIAMCRPCHRLFDARKK